MSCRFEPECLTIALGSGCNLDCTYCYGKVGSENDGAPSESLDRPHFLDAIRAAAELLAATGARRRRRLVFGFQGLGEPFLDQDLLASADEVVREVAERARMAVSSYITSNGTLGQEQYRWAATRFDRICLSLDGPPSLHDLARRYRVGGHTSAKVRETTELLIALGKVPACRVTVTRQSVSGLVDTARFLMVELGLTDIVIEPAYRHADQYPEAEAFVEGLLWVREIANRCGAKVSYSGYRPGERHGPYCQTARGVLFLTRNGRASACLFREHEGRESPFCVGEYAPSSGRFVLDEARIEAFEAKMARLPQACAACPARHHCVRGCPDYCPLDGAGEERRITETLRCRINQRLHQATIDQRLHQATVERVRVAPAVPQEDLPVVLQSALRESREIASLPSNLSDHVDEWNRFLENARATVPSLRIDDRGATVCLGKLSPGCAHCKAGRWDCVFVTKRCNMACSFCCSARGGARQRVTSAFGDNLEQMVENYGALGIGGVSISGGEPWLEPDRTFSLIESLRRRMGACYLWLYTNGVLLRPEQIDRLADLGLDEIRFNTAATGYADPIVHRTIARAARRIPAVAVEIPVIPGEEARIKDRVSSWASAGVKYLNLHELMREPGSRSASLPGIFRKRILPDGHVTDVSLESRFKALETMRAVVDGHIPLHVNFCSFTNKLLQIRGRRRNLAMLRRQPHERLWDGEYLETVLAFASRDQYAFSHPDEIPRLQAEGGKRLFLLRRTVPLSLEDPGRVVHVEPVGSSS